MRLALHNNHSMSNRSAERWKDLEALCGRHGGIELHLAPERVEVDDANGLVPPYCHAFSRSIELDARQEEGSRTRSL